ncbi:MAG: hypothetical protein ABW046_12585 [Actinoplanes sp.]
MQTAVAMLPLSVPCVVAAVAKRRGDLTRRRAWEQRDRQETDDLRRLDRALAAVEQVPSPPPPPLDEIVIDLRHLDQRRRTGPSSKSRVWRAAVLDAYDVRLCLACECVGVREDLGPLAGMDREIERVRVEGALEAAGLDLR